MLFGEASHLAKATDFPMIILSGSKDFKSYYHYYFIIPFHFFRYPGQARYLP